MRRLLGNVFIAISEFGAIIRPNGASQESRPILTLPPDAIDPTQGGGSGTSSDQATTGSNAFAEVDLDSLVPTTADVPMNLIHLDTHHRSLDEVAQNYTDAATTVDLFTSWGWVDNIACSYGMPDGVYPEPEQINGIYVSIHAFGSPDGARAALDFSLEQQAVGTPLREVASPGLGDYSRALYGTLDYGNEITFLVQKGNLLLRLSAASLAVDPPRLPQRSCSPCSIAPARAWCSVSDRSPTHVLQGYDYYINLLLLASR